MRLIIKGCRGVRMERAGEERSINQAATIGFSANLVYAPSRCDTFVPYLLEASKLVPMIALLEKRVITFIRKCPIYVNPQPAFWAQVWKVAE